MDSQQKTLLMTDLVDSTALVETLGDHRSGEIFAAIETHIRHRLATLGGLEIDKTDGFLMLFDRPLDAVRFALGVHDDLAALSQTFDVVLSSRCGIHVGEVLLRRNTPDDVARGAKPLEVEGLAKPITARIMAIASGGQTLLSRAAYDQTMRQARHTTGLEETVWSLHGLYKLKGISDPMLIGEVAAPGRATRPPPRPDASYTRRLSGRYLFALTGVLFAAFVGLFDTVDMAIQHTALDLLHGPLAIENTVIVGISDQDDYRALRASHPSVIARLVDAGATAVVFDIAMTAQTPMDDALADAIEAATARNVAVILPVHIRENAKGVPFAQGPKSPRLANAAILGNVEFLHETRLGTIQAAKVRRRTETEDIWAAAAHALQAHLNARQPIRIQDGDLVVGGTRNPVWADQAWLPPFGIAPVQDYFEDTLQQDFTGKVAVVGAYGGREDQIRTLNGSRYGVELHAALIETLIRQRTLEIVAPEANVALTAVSGFLTTLMSWALLFRWRGAAVFIPVATLCIIAALTWAGIMTAITAPMLAAFLGYKASSIQMNGGST
jgi:class 3 adenylate cyclase/CHASE2 domain-containing sensor protein